MFEDEEPTLELPVEHSDRQTPRVSIDCEAWVIRPGPLRDALFAVSRDWIDEFGEFNLDGDGWQILVTQAESLDHAEADIAVAGVLTGVERRVGITLEPITDDRDAMSMLNAVVASIVTTCGGVAADPSTGELVVAP